MNQQSTSISVENWDVSSIENFADMFQGCRLTRTLVEYAFFQLPYDEYLEISEQYATEQAELPASERDECKEAAS